MKSLSLPFLKKGCAYNFNVLVSGGFSDHFVECCNDSSRENVYTAQFYLFYYDVNYAHAIVEYYKACGCRVIDWEYKGRDELFDIKYTLPTKSVNAENWYRNTYTPGILITPQTLITAAIIIGGLILIGLLLFYHFLTMG